MDNGLGLLIPALLGYALGSIPFGLILTKVAGMGDVRNIGSGNIGATNVLRTGKKGLAAATLLLDLVKGFVPVWLVGHYWGGTAAGTAALAAVIGHCFPVWLKFKGGKGVATNAGVCFGLAWPIGAAYAVTWLLILALFRFSSLAGMTAVVAAPIAAWQLDMSEYVPFLVAIAMLIIWLHRANISRLIGGSEPKVGSKN
ncbi:glycerol-3-phosphate 1-O-acyltransferase PlsY [Pontixanthobacter aquaemixtae]|uniref:Glycerol-3-phosphate acyltransferase n=1 Tax=Pontixanthobacter aquaemixtae TaxID=1958940 RepID=A0A844ZT87_9SPHN|nr:glycerol-3-phosphate 1-O-acyltransferase PlsY [Pontixanthobacter aquaemixtae]MXO90027.1 glycerol-3-phosphate 1-O-acyltransferase PlsY [Pontixanthobacter aquaemixtae]